ncbi:MAG: hypothetical protein HY791_10325 [Deltaproteobacteria bacterium]|nr:hypothetical protein [Deltaproteobacteria bacterium]
MAHLREHSKTHGQADLRPNHFSGRAKFERDDRVAIHAYSRCSFVLVLVRARARDRRAVPILVLSPILMLMLMLILDSNAWTSASRKRT